MHVCVCVAVRRRETAGAGHPLRQRLRGGRERDVWRGGGGKGGELLEVVQELQAHSAALACLAWLPDGRGLVSAPVSEAAQATAGSGGEWEWVAPVDSFKATGSTLAMWRVTE